MQIEAEQALCTVPPSGFKYSHGTRACKTVCESGAHATFEKVLAEA